MFLTLINIGAMGNLKKMETNSNYSCLQYSMINWATNFVIRLLEKGRKMNRSKTINKNGIAAVLKKAQAGGFIK